MVPFKPCYTLLRGTPVRMNNPTITVGELLAIMVVDRAIYRCMGYNV